MHVFKSRRLTSTILIFLLCVPSIAMCTNDGNNNDVPFYQNPTIITLALTTAATFAALGTAFCEYKTTKHNALRSKHESKIKLIDRLREIEKDCQDEARRLSLQKRIDNLTLSLAESCMNS